MSGIIKNEKNEIGLDKSEYGSLFKELSELKFALDKSAIIGITDKSGRITFVNDKFCEISQYSRSELIGQDHRIINSGYHPKKFIKNLWTTIKSGNTWRGEIRNRAKEIRFTGLTPRLCLFWTKTESLINILLCGLKLPNESTLKHLSRKAKNVTVCCLRVIRFRLG